mgnify:CR=1 FL=1
MTQTAHRYIFTSESVTEGHPDKLCDQISDAVVDHFVSLEPYSTVRCECAVSGAIIFIAAHFASSITVDFTHLARKVVKEIGYDQPDFNPKSCSILTSPRAEAVDPATHFDEYTLTDAQIEAIPAKNQVTVFGYAVNESPVLMPLPIYMANKLTRRLTHARKQKILPYLMADAKVQVGVQYERWTPRRIHSLTLEVQTRTVGKPDADTLKADLMEAVVTPVFENLPVTPDGETVVHINPNGPYLGGPLYHSGLTGRKCAVDTYGEYARHSGKALSGKDPLRVDRIGVYAARYVAKNVVAAGLASACEIMVSYATGASQPVSILVNTFGTGTQPDGELAERLRSRFDFRPAGILKRFGLRQLPGQQAGGFFQKLSANGHVGRDDMDLPWEQTDMF